MLKKRSRGVTSKQSVMADSASLLSPTNKYTKPNSSFFNSPLLFTGLTTKGLSETDALKSPTSTLDGMLFSGLANPFWADKTSNTTKSSQEASLENKHPWMQKLDSRGIVDALSDDASDQKWSKSNSRMVLFGSQLKIQIPPQSPFPPSQTDFPKSPADFGIKTRNSQLELYSSAPNPSPPSSVRKSPFGSVNSGVEGSPRVFTGCLSAREMESSEDYTCVITHGPNPKTTHIFDDCIVDDCCGVVGLSSLSKGNWFLADNEPSYLSDDFLSFCYTCKKNLVQGKDIYIYRGEKAFCSCECRHQEILFEEGMEKTDLDESVKN